jgi:oligopeptide transport system permease protein
MFEYLFRKFLYILIVIFVVATLTFVMARAIPGGPFTREKPLPPAVLKNVEARYNLDKPIFVQYLVYMGNMVRLDFGPSFRYEALTVNDIIKQTFPVSVILGSIALLLALFFGLLLGTIAALYQNKWQDSSLMLFSLIGVSIPSFILATFFMFTLGFKLKLFPVAGWGSWNHIILPALTLCAYPMAFIAKTIRSNMLEVLSQDYIKVARAKGLPDRIVLFRHAIKNAILPVVTYLGPLIAGIFTGSFLVENIFAIPGLGKYFVSSIYDRDYTVILGVTVFYCILLVVLNFLVDVSYSFIDPRIRVVKKDE